MKRILSNVLVTALAAGCLAAQPFHASAAEVPLSELLEKAIYTEETRGDIVSAISIYQQLLADAKASQSITAQAQFRLAQCFLKQNRMVEAEAAFEKLIRDFPQEKELVAKAREQATGVLALLPIPWVDGERLQFTLKGSTGQDLGTVEYRADSVQNEGRSVWRFGLRMYAASGAGSVSRVDVDSATFRPMSSYSKYDTLGVVSATYREDGSVEMHRPGTDVPKLATLDKPVFDNDQHLPLLRRLPLEVGYKGGFPLFTTVGGGFAIPISLDVTAKEKITTAAGTFDCFKVELSLNQTFWLSDDAHRYLVKFEAVGVTGTLDSISQRRADEAVPFADQALGIGVTAPAGWVIHKRSTGSAEEEALLQFLDPEAIAEPGMLYLFDTTKLSPAARHSPRAWMEAVLKNGGGARRLKDLKVRPESWRNQNVAGRIAALCTADYMEHDRAMVLLLAAMHGPKKSEQFVFACPADQFEALKPAFESIIASYRAR